MTEVEELRLRLAATRAELAVELLRFVYDHHEAIDWMITPQKSLAHQKPSDLVLTDDGWLRLYQHINHLRDLLTA